MKKITIPHAQKLEIFEIASKYMDLYDFANEQYSIWIKIQPIFKEIFDTIAEIIIDKNVFFKNNIFVELFDGGTKNATIILRSGNIPVAPNVIESGFQIILKPLLNGVISIIGSSHTIDEEESEIVYQDYLEPIEMSPDLVCEHFIKAFKAVQLTSYLNQQKSKK